MWPFKKSDLQKRYDALLIDNANERAICDYWGDQYNQMRTAKNLARDENYVLKARIQSLSVVVLNLRQEVKRLGVDPDTIDRKHPHVS